MGWLCHATGRAEEAIEHFDRALELARELGWGHGQTSERANIARASASIARDSEPGSSQWR